MTRAATVTALWLLCWAVLFAMVGCAPAPAPEAACALYAARRVAMPRPLPDDALGRWVAVTDAGLTGACR